MNVAPPQEKKAGCKKHEHNADQRGKIISIPYPRAIGWERKTCPLILNCFCAAWVSPKQKPKPGVSKAGGRAGTNSKSSLNNGLILGMVTPKMPQQIPVEHWKQIYICNLRKKGGEARPSPAQMEFSTSFPAESAYSLFAGIRIVGEALAPLSRSHSESFSISLYHPTTHQNTF